jgi:hypothetical protein
LRGLPRRVESANQSLGKRATVTRISHDDYTIHHLVETDGGFLVAFSGLAAYYHTTEPTLQQTIRAAHAAKREVSITADRHCELFSVTMHAPRSIGRRIVDRLERLTEIITRRSTGWWRDAERATRKAK